MANRFPTGRTFNLNGDVSPDQSWLVVPGVLYIYKNGMCECPLCGGTGTPWAGWFHCDGKCRGVAWIETGEMLIPVEFKSKNHQGVTNGN